MSGTTPDLHGSTLMNAIGLMELAVALTIVGAALAAFNVLVGKGPRGTVWLVAACILTWSCSLPNFLSEGGEVEYSRAAHLIVEVLQVCGVIGLVIGVIDVLQKRA